MDATPPLAGLPEFAVVGLSALCCIAPVILIWRLIAGRKDKVIVIQQPTPPPAAPAADTPAARLAELKRTLDAGLIDQVEYDRKRAEIVAKM
jgi:hypothetical protein